MPSDYSVLILEYEVEHDIEEQQAKLDGAESRHSSSLKRARRARHEVYVPSILGPSTLEATSYNENAGESARNGHAAQSTTNVAAHASGSGAHGLSSNKVVVKTEPSSDKPRSSNAARKSGQKSQAQERKAKKRKTTKTNQHIGSPNIPIDPDEPTYCLCEQVR